MFVYASTIPQYDRDSHNATWYKCKYQGTREMRQFMCKYTSGSGLSVVVLGPRIFRVCSTHTYTPHSRSPTKRDRTYHADVKEANSHFTILLICLCTDLTKCICPTFTSIPNYSKHGSQEFGAEQFKLQYPYDNVLLL